MNDVTAIVFKPVYESMMTLIVLTDKGLIKYGELGPKLAREVKKRFSPGFMSSLADKTRQKDLAFLAHMMVLSHDRPVSTAAEFLAWFNGLSINELLNYYSFAPSLVKEFMTHLERLKKDTDFLTEWETNYAKNIDPSITELLKSDAEDKSRFTGNVHAGDLIEQLTQGIRLEETAGKKKIVLVPQYHGRPFNYLVNYPEAFICHYPVDPLPVPGDPSPRLLRLTTALADQSRLRIMKYLSQGERSFTDIVKFSGLAKSTVHHHTAILRAAGLIRCHVRDSYAFSYSLRCCVLDDISENLRQYIEQDYR